MKFSEHFQIQVTDDEDWFDPVLSLDTRLFLDPFLLYADESGHFIGSHKEVVSFFNCAFRKIAESGGNRHSVSWRKAESLLLFREVEEICLGYTGEGTSGSGSGAKFAKTIAEALWEAVAAGITEITHFEEIGILREGIGADRISDATANLLRRRLSTYTIEICQRHSIPLNTRRYLRGSFDLQLERWRPLSVQLPINPYNRKPVLLIPRRYLRHLPTVNADDFWEYCYTHENETIRTEFNYDISRRVSKAVIVQIARNHPNLRRRYIQSVEEAGAEPYDFSRDPKDLLNWYEATSKFVQDVPLTLHFSSVSQFQSVIDRIVCSFKLYVEENAGWSLLWNDDNTPKREAAAQALFLGIVKHYCAANDIDISKEANIGRGPVDFKVSHGYKFRALLEVKLARNTRFWSGIERQLPKYMHAEDVKIGFFLVVVFDERDAKRITEISKRIRVLNRQTGYDLKEIIVDASANPLSASKL